MPNTPHTVPSRTGLAPVPVAILLPPPPTVGRRVRPGNRRGLSAHTACQLIARYTRPGELVLDLDANPAITAAARWLDRPSRATTDTHLTAADPSRIAPSAGLAVGCARLVIATLPRPGATTLPRITDWMRQLRAGPLAPGGFLIAVVTTIGAGRVSDHATTIIAAATAAGLSWHQQLIDVHTRLPEPEPRAEPDTAAATVPRLIRGRHHRIHSDLYVFTTSGGEDIDA